MRLFFRSFTLVQELKSSPSSFGKKREWWRQVRMGCLCVVFAGSLQACATSTSRYMERHTITDLKIVFLDEQSLQEEWKKISGRPGVEFVQKMNMTVPQVKTVKGFYDFHTHTVFCPKWNFEVCGHELHHAILGQFHDAS